MGVLVVVAVVLKSELNVRQIGREKERVIVFYICTEEKAQLNY